MSANKVNESVIEFMLLSAALFILFLATVNINNYLAPTVVLGAKTIVLEENDEFWDDFLSKNPQYIPGWIETGNFEMAREIDPNYITP